MGENIYFKNKEIKKLLAYYKKIWALGHVDALMGWDLETYMPEKGVIERGTASSQIDLFEQRLLLDKEFVKSVDLVSRIDGLNDYEKGVVRELKRDISIKKRIPPRLIEEESLAATKGVVAWRNARKKSNFGIFRPYLEEIVRIEREKAEKLGYKEHPYDALLDLYEEDMRVREVDSIFSDFIPRLKQILDRVISEKKFTKGGRLEKIKYNMTQMQAVNKKTIDMLGYDMGRFRVDVSAHPFTTTIGSNDVRITTRYEGIDFKRVLFSTIHESGHALYELQCDSQLAMTPVFGGISLGIHESQSRFWENMIGRSRPFVHAITPMLKGQLTFLKGIDEEEMYHYFNRVKPGMIRVDADELTYNFHIVIRYEIEKLLMKNEIKTKELPEFWNEKMEEYLGIKPKNDAEGVLQDIHWSQGSIGYFPTYSLGNIVSAIVRAKAMKEIKNFDGKIGAGDFKPLQDWLKEKIHRYGSTYKPKELLKKALGEGYNPIYLTAYLNQKFLG